MLRRINLIAPSGFAKSTCALKLAGELKSQGVSVEYINEFAKNWLYENRPKPTSLDQIFIGATQMYQELRALKHNKYIITDSALILAAVYAEYYSADLDAAQILKDMSIRMEQDYQSLNIILNKPNFNYSQDGRWQTEEETAEVQNIILKYTLDHFQTRVANSYEEVRNIVENIIGACHQ